METSRGAGVVDEGKTNARHQPTPTDDFARADRAAEKGRLLVVQSEQLRAVARTWREAVAAN